LFIRSILAELKLDGLTITNDSHCINARVTKASIALLKGEDEVSKHDQNILVYMQQLTEINEALEVAYCSKKRFEKSFSLTQHNHKADPTNQEAIDIANSLTQLIELTTQLKDTEDSVAASSVANTPQEFEMKISLEVSRDHQTYHISIEEIEKSLNPPTKEMFSVLCNIIKQSLF